MPHSQPKPRSRVPGGSYAVNGRKRCSGCKRTLPVSEFGKNKALKDGLAHNCKNCNRAFKKHHQPNSRTARYKRLYGLSNYDDMYAQQQGRCAICRGEFPPYIKTGLHVDHSHATRKVRGLLYNNCNWMLGAAKENLLTLQAAITYLERRLL